MKTTKMKGMRIDNDLLAKIEALAKQENRTFSGMVNHVLMQFFKAHFKRIKNG